MPRSKVFVSHISKEAALASLLQESIRRDFIGLIDVYVSSDNASIEAGEDWLKSVKSALKRSDAMIVLCSKDSVGRPWVNFEAGAAWLREVPIIPVCHTDLAPDDLPLPLRLLEAVNASQPIDIERLYGRLAKIIGADKPNANYPEIAKAIKDCERGYRSAKKHGAALDRIPNPRILCAASEQYAKTCEYNKDVAVLQETFTNSEMVVDGKLTVPRLCEMLTGQQFDIIHLVNFVDPLTGALRLSESDHQSPKPVGDAADDLSADGFSKLVEVCGARLVVRASCESLILGAKLSRVTNMIAAYSTLLTPDVIAWENNFYRILAKGHPLSRAHDVSAATTRAPMILMMKKDVAFAPEPLISEN